MDEEGRGMGMGMGLGWGLVTVALHLDKQPRELAIGAGRAAGGGTEEVIGCGDGACSGQHPPKKGRVY